MAGLFGFLSLIMLGTVAVAPDKFVTCFSITLLTVIAGLASMSGPRVYIKNLFRNKNLYASIVLITTMIFSLYFSMIARDYLMSILMSIIELNAVMYFFCNTTAINLTTLKYMAKIFWTAFTGMFRREV